MDFAKGSNVQRKQEQCPPRSKRKWRANEKKQSGKIHRMTDKSVYPSWNHFLSFFDTDIRSKGIHFSMRDRKCRRRTRRVSPARAASRSSAAIAC